MLLEKKGKRGRKQFIIAHPAKTDRFQGLRVPVAVLVEREGPYGDVANIFFMIRY